MPNFANVNKYLLLLVLCCSPILLWAQQGERLNLVSSLQSRIDGTTGKTITYRPVYDHNGSTLKADSGVLYRDELEREFFDAFGNVVITQPNGTIIFANKLNYSAETRLAILTGNVRMVDQQAVLTTNYLTYNMRSGIGTYTGGGRIINQTDTITSKNAWYFDQTKDAYFRHDVVVRNPDIKIYTDTMRYNTNLKESYFYGPTNMRGNNGENLYTELGFYNTDNQNASFFQKNLYTEKSRFLTGDTLHYDGKTGNGKALNNVHFIDTADNFHLQGGIGVYDKLAESITMTRLPLMTYITTSTDTLQQDSTNLLIDSIGSPIPRTQTKTDSLFLTADTLFSQQIFLKDYVPIVFNLDREGGELMESEEENFGEEDSLGENGIIDSLQTGTDSLSTEMNKDLDSLKNVSDSLKNQVDSLQSGLDSAKLGMNDSLINQKITVQADSVVRKKSEILKTVDAAAIRASDSLLRQQAIIPKGHEVDSLMKSAVLSVLTPKAADSLSTDSIQPSDTTRTRIIKAFNNVRIYKSDLQAIADSMYFGYPDSMMRLLGQPLIWAQGSQLSSEELYLQIKNSKVDNMILVNNAFVTNALKDSTRFNQMKGRRIIGFFKNDNLERLFVDGNAENLFFNVDEDSGVVTEMYHNRSSRIKVLFENKELSEMIPIKNVDGKIYPIQLAPAEEQQLKGFVWRPGERPKSKEDLLTKRRTPTILTVPTDSVSQDATITRDATIPPPPTKPGVIPAQAQKDTVKVLPKPTTPPDSVLNRLKKEADSLKNGVIDTTKKISYLPEIRRNLQNHATVYALRVESARPRYISLALTRRSLDIQPKRWVPIHAC